MDNRFCNNKYDAASILLPQQKKSKMALVFGWMLPIMPQSPSCCIVGYSGHSGIFQHPKLTIMKFNFISR
ncbi:MAG: hypothetical protein H0X50_05210 [Nitrosopumilus sp.]|nr:hypothetical protein [Nitrosopumilus sp.]